MWRCAINADGKFTNGSRIVISPVFSAYESSRFTTCIMVIAFLLLIEKYKLKQKK
jgi:hypothetical protein